MLNLRERGEECESYSHWSKHKQLNLTGTQGDQTLNQICFKFKGRRHKHPEEGVPKFSFFIIYWPFGGKYMNRLHVIYLVMISAFNIFKQGTRDITLKCKYSIGYFYAPTGSYALVLECHYPEPRLVWVGSGEVQH